MGSFIGDRWKEWNGKFRDDIRSFFKGDQVTVTKLPARFLASPDLYGHQEREPEQSINFVTCHDGFTLNDLVSYNYKHNEANGEGNRDGHDENLSWNLLEKHSDIHRFVKQMIRLRLSLAVFQEDHGLSLNQLLQRAEIDWHGIKLNQPDWTDHSHSLAFTVRGRKEFFHIIFNAYREALEFELPPSPVDPQAAWRRIIDTFRESPEDICSMAEAPPLGEKTYLVQPHSVALPVRDLQQ